MSYERESFEICETQDIYLGDADWACQDCTWIRIQCKRRSAGIGNGNSLSFVQLVGLVGAVWVTLLHVGIKVCIYNVIQAE